RLERVGSHGAGVDPPGGVAEEVVETGHVRGGEQEARLAVADVADVLPADDDPAVRVQRDAADAATLRHDRRDLAVGRAPVDPAVPDVAEVEVVGGVAARPLDEAVAERERLHRHGRIAPRSRLRRASRRTEGRPRPPRPYPRSPTRTDCRRRCPSPTRASAGVSRAGLWSL